jgi:cobalt/nickel transport system permease protein
LAGALKDINLPEWLLESSRPSGQKRGRVHSGFLTKTLSGLFSVYENEFYCEKFAVRHGFLQGIDVRVKFLTLLFFMFFGAFSHSITVLLLLAITAVVYAKLSGLPLRDYLRRVWLYIPLFVLILSLPAATDFYIKGRPVFYLYASPQLNIYFTQQGLLAALRLSLRSGVSLSMGYLLIITTRWPGLMKALSALHMPKAFIAVLSMAYRYIFVLCEAALSMIQSRFLRTMGKVKAKENRRFFGRGIAFLFLRTSALSDDIYDAMCCRGYTGKAVSLETLKLSGVDILFIINNIVIILILLIGERLF